MSGYRYPHLRWGLHVRRSNYPRVGTQTRWTDMYIERPSQPIRFHGHPVERRRDFGDFLALLAGGLIAGILMWIFVVGLFAIGAP